jgi:hypothetical protein
MLTQGTTSSDTLSIAGAKKSAFQSLAKSSSQPEESTTFVSGLVLAE